MILFEQFVLSGWIAIFAMVVLVIEMLVLLRIRPGKERLQIVCNSCSGLTLMAAVYCALRAFSFWTIPLFLILSLLAHLGDVSQRSSA